MTCGLKVGGRNAQAGHYMPKGACGLEYYFSEENVHCQCGKCNLYLQGNLPEYRKFIIEKYGIKTLERIEREYHKPTKDYPFEEKIAHYKELCRDL